MTDPSDELTTELIAKALSRIQALEDALNEIATRCAAGCDGAWAAEIAKATLEQDDE
jgi:hypothetical protein